MTADTELSRGIKLLGKRVRKPPYLLPMSPTPAIAHAVSEHGLVTVRCPHCATDVGQYLASELEEMPGANR